MARSVSTADRSFIQRATYPRQPRLPLDPQFRGGPGTAWLEPERGNIHGTEQRQKTPEPVVLDGPRRPAPLASPPAAAMILCLCLNEMVLQSSERELSLRQRQP